MPYAFRAVRGAGTAIVRGDPDAVIADRHDRLLSVTHDTDFNNSTGRRVFGRVVD
jgi:hypothetical protein